MSPSLLHACCCRLLLVGLLGAALPAGDLIDVPPYLQDLGPSGVTIMWHTASPSCGQVAYGENGALDGRVAASQDGLRPVDTWHRVRLTGLRPGATVSYRVAARPVDKVFPYKTPVLPEECSATATFTVPASDAPAFRLLIVNDLHNKVDLLRTLMTRAPDTWDATLFLGDCFAELKDEAAVAALLRDYLALVQGASRPALFVRGNHEIRGPFARQFDRIHEHPGGRPYFAFTAGPARIILPDCGEDKADSHPEYGGLNDFTGFRLEQVGWLRQQLEAPEARHAAFRVLAHHIPLHGPHSSETSWQTWRDTIAQGRIDVALAGHTHRRALLQPDEAGNPYPELVGGGKTPESATISILDVDASRLQIRMLTTDGAEAFALQLPRR